MATSRALRWAILGTGDIAHTTAPDLIATENLELVAVGSRTQESADAFAAEFGIPVAHGSYEAVYGDDSIDVVYICTPHSLHFPMARDALLAGKHVLCEKAFTLDAAEARELARLAADRGLFLMEAMWMKFFPLVREIIDRVSAGAIGEVKNITAAFGAPIPVAAQGRMWDPALGAGALLDMGVYTITFAHMLLGKPDRVVATGRLDDRGVDVYSTVSLQYGADSAALLQSSFASLLNPVAAVSGTKGMIATNFFFFRPTELTVYTLPFGEPEVLAEPLVGHGYVPMFRAVSEAIGAGLLEHPYNPLSDTIDVLEIMDEVKRQLKAQVVR